MDWILLRRALLVNPDTAHWLLLLLLLSGRVILGGYAWGQDSVTVTLDPSVTLRGLAETYLHDPNAWPEILRANRLDSADQLRTGVRLRIPVASILGLARTQRELRALIYQATAAGAQVFATTAISDALVKQARAVEAKRRGALAEAEATAQQGIAAARRALATSLRSRDVPAEAVLDEAGGSVQRRRPSEFDWTQVAVKALLAEQTRLRTLSESYAVVRFRDASSLRMSANALLAIRRIRRDLLTDQEQVGVVLYGGDVRALIDPGSGFQGVTVEVPGIETGVRSNHYWVRKTRQATRLANYDGEIEVSAQGNTVVVGQNQGTLVPSTRPPNPPVDLLSPPVLSLPANGQVRYDTGVEFRWGGDQDAKAYWLEVARDRDFTQLLFTKTGIAEAAYYLPIATEGLYYWRVSAIDALGLPGPASDIRHFHVRWDSAPPFLVLNEPANEYRSREPIVRVAGQVEPGSTLTLSGEAVPVASDGRFATEQKLAAGANTLHLEAQDAAGNLSRLERIVRYAADSDLPLRFAVGLPRDPQGRLVVNGPRLALEGSTLARSAIRISRGGSSELIASGVADHNGSFSLNLPVDAGGSRFMIDTTGPSGQHRGEAIDVVVDQRPPIIRIDPPLPTRTSASVLALSGQVEDGLALFHGDQSVALSADGAFTLKVGLRPGANRVALTARDLAGNERLWEQTITLDQEPPQLVDYRLVEEETRSGRTLRLVIEAKDQSGLTAGIPYSVQVGEVVYQGIARRCPDRRCHRDRIALPATASGRPRLISVTVQDYLGNRREIKLD